MRNMWLCCAALLVNSVGLTACTNGPQTPAAVRIRWAADAVTLDPLEVSTPQDLEAFNLLHYCLLVLDTRTLTYQPMLAEAPPQVQVEGKVTRLRYTIRPEATWDTGQPILARDVAYTLKVYNCPGLATEATRVMYDFVQDIELDSSNARRFTLVCTTSSAQELLQASGQFAILPEYSLDPHGSLRSIPLPLLIHQPATAEKQYPALKSFAHRYNQTRHELQPGSGPYRVAKWQRNQYLRLERKSNWWGRKLLDAPTWLQAHAQGLNYSTIPDEATAMLALRRGNIDVYPNPSAHAFAARQQSQDTVQFMFKTADSYRMTVVGFNTESPVLRAAATRRALSMLLDVEGIIRATQPKLAYRSVSLINPHDTLTYNSNLPLVPFAPSQALAQLLAAGWQQHADHTLWQDGRPLAPSITYLAGNPEQETIAVQFRAAAATIGIDVTLRPQISSLLESQLSAGKMDVYIRSMGGSPHTYNFRPILHSSGISVYNFTRFNNAAADQLMTNITVETDPQRLAGLVRRFQVLLRQESPLVVLYFTRYRLIANRHLQGVQATSIRPGYDVLSMKQETGKVNQGML